MVAEGSLPRLQNHTTGSYTEPVNPIHTFPPYFQIYFNIIFQGTPRSSCSFLIDINEMCS